MVKSSVARRRAPDLDRVFHALADPTRRTILRDLTAGERTVTELARPHRMSLVAVSKHLKVLERARLVDRRRDGSFHLLSLRAEALRAADEWLRHYERFWNERLDSLKNVLEGDDT
jgi:DNA-binding transcriptional ArsR family regulator